MAVSPQGSKKASHRQDSQFTTWWEHGCRDLIGTREAPGPWSSPTLQGPPKLPSPAHLRGTREQTRGVSPSRMGMKELRSQGQAQLFLSRETIQTWELALPHSWKSLLQKFLKWKRFIQAPMKVFLGQGWTLCSRCCCPQPRALVSPAVSRILEPSLPSYWPSGHLASSRSPPSLFHKLSVGLDPLWQAGLACISNMENCVAQQWERLPLIKLGYKKCQCFRWTQESLWMDMNLGKLQEMVRVREAWHAAVHGVAKSWTWLGDWTTTRVSQGFPGGASGRKSAYQCRRFKRHMFDPGLGRSPGVGNGYPLQYSCLENPMDWGAWQAIVHGVAKSQAWLSAHVSHPEPWVQIEWEGFTDQWKSQVTTHSENQMVKTDSFFQADSDKGDKEVVCPVWMSVSL